MSNRFRRRVKRHTEDGGRGSHNENDPDGVRVQITYSLFDCRYCPAEGIASKADFDTWAEVWPSVESHLKDEHPEKLDNDHA